MTRRSLFKTLLGCFSAPFVHQAITDSKLRALVNSDTRRATDLLNQSYTLTISGCNPEFSKRAVLEALRQEAPAIRAIVSRAISEDCKGIK